MQQEPRRQTEQIIIRAPGFDTINIEATEYYASGAGTPSYLLGEHSTVDFGNSADGSGSSLARSLQSGGNPFLYDFHNIGVSISNRNTSASVANASSGVGSYQTPSRRLSDSDIFTAEVSYGLLPTYFDGSQRHEQNAINNAIEQGQNQRKRKPSLEVGICYTP
jgi:hypothetical protein